MDAAAYNIICFGFMPWSGMWKRNQSMMAEMSKCAFVRQVIFVNPIISIRDHFGPIHTKKTASFGASSHVFPRKVLLKVKVYQPATFLPLKTKFPKLKKLEDYIILKIIRHLNRGMPYILFMNCPNIRSPILIDTLLEKAELSLFDFSDDFTELGFDESTKALFRHNSEKYARAADMVLAVNEHIKEKYSHLNSNIQVIRNATNYDNFNREDCKPIELLEKIKETINPIIGYSGSAGFSRIDTSLLDFLIEERPLWQYIFVGPAHQNFVERYAKYQNVHLMAPVSYQDLPSYMRYFDVAMVPFLVNAHTKGNDLLKLHDFLAMGKPVVCTDIGGAKDFQELVSIAKSPSAFLEKLENALRPQKEEEILKRKSKAMENSWPTRIMELKELICHELNKVH
jgi:glycosyltransferase involved in cell wall biosynthesis